jgi:hypothetical protein
MKEDFLALFLACEDIYGRKPAETKLFLQDMLVVNLGQKVDPKDQAAYLKALLAKYEDAVAQLGRSSDLGSFIIQEVKRRQYMVARLL